MRIAIAMLVCASLAAAQYIPPGGGGAATSITIDSTTATGGTNGDVLVVAAGKVSQVSLTSGCVPFENGTSGFVQCDSPNFTYASSILTVPQVTLPFAT